MIKKIILTLTTFILLVSCSSAIAKSQYERGEYRSSIKTTLSYANSKTFDNLDTSEKNQLINRFTTIDNYYKNKEIRYDITSLKTLYDIFSIQYMLRNENKIIKYFPYISSQNLNHNLNRISNMIDSLIYYDKYNLETIYLIQRDMRKNNLLNSEFSNEYKKISKQIADVYISKYQMSDKRDGLEYIKKAYICVSDFDPNYRNVHRKYKDLEKELDLIDANRLLDNAKRLYFQEEYEKAISKLNESKELFLKHYSEYDYIIREINEYLESSKRKINEYKAMQYYNLGLNELDKRNYSQAVKYFILSDQEVSGYKKSKEYIRKYGKYLNKKYYSIDSNSKYKNIIEDVLDDRGLDKSNSNYDYYIFYDEYYEYSYEDEFPYYIEKLKIRPVCIINGKRYEFGESNFKKKSLNLHGKDRLIREESKNSKSRIEFILNSVIR